MSQLIFLLTCLLSLSTFAQTNHLLIVGGGGEPKGTTTLFDQNLKNIGGFIKRDKTWIPTIAFNGGHDETEKIISDMTPSNIYTPKKPFSKEEFEKIISRYEEKIRSGEVGPKDKILLYIDSHGKTQAGEKTHSVKTSDSPHGSVSLDKLQDLIDLAQEKGVKLGIIDASCHSGNTLKLRRGNACIISATSPNTYSTSKWSENLSNNFKRGKNLEQVFLETYPNRQETTFPMISTDAGDEIQFEFENIFEKYLVYKMNKNEDLFTDEISKGLNKVMCGMEAVFDKGPIGELIKLENKIRESTATSPSFNGLISKIKKYQVFQSKIRKDLIVLGAEDLKKQKKQICSAKVCNTWSEYEILSMDLDVEIDRYIKISINAKKSDKDWYLAFIENLKKAKIYKDELFEKNPNNQKVAGYYKSLPDLSSKTYTMALEVSQELQSVYKAIYDEKTRNNPGPNPCKNFVF